MITDIPSDEEFKNNGIAFLNLAWESLLSMSENVSAVTDDLEEEDERQSYEEEYWREARQELGVAVALTQQGAEFLIKGRICEVSPFLLLSVSSGLKAQLLGWQSDASRLLSMPANQPSIKHPWSRSSHW